MAEWAGIGLEELCSRSEARGLVQARDLLVYAALRFFFYPNQKLARFLHRTASAISYSRQRAEVMAKNQPNMIHSVREYLLRL